MATKDLQAETQTKKNYLINIIIHLPPEMCECVRAMCDGLNDARNV